MTIGVDSVFTYQMPLGIDGAINRVGGRGPDIEAQIMDSDHPIPYYGLAGILDSVTGLLRRLATGDDHIDGFLVRPFPLQATTASGYSGMSQLGTAAVPPTSGTAALMRGGYISTTLRGATAAVNGGAVYARIDSDDATHPLGCVEAADDGAHTILVSGAYFKGDAVAGGKCEVAYNV